MSEFKGTKGPWIVRDEEIQSVGTEGSMTAMCYGLDNARLIAAAPELLEALQSLLATQILPDFHAEKFRRVVAKALGQ